MKIYGVWQTAGITLTVLCVAACSSNQYQSNTKNVPDDKSVATDQAQWQKLTSAAEGGC